MTVAWSYSYLQAFETCPKRFYHTKIAKDVIEPQTEALTHGNEVHKALELAVAENRPLPEKYKTYIPIVEAVKASPGIKKAEMKFGLTKSFAPTTFFAKDVWVRGVLDFTAINGKSATVLDWKTGKPKTDGDQMKLFAGATFALYPSVEKVKTGYVWLAHNKVDAETYTRDDIPAIWNEFIPRVERVEYAIKNSVFNPNPSGLCRAWCPVPRSKCEFSGKA